MNLSNIKYVFTIKGKLFGRTTNKLYAITEKNEVLHTNTFNKLEDAEPKFLFQLNEDLDYEKHSNHIGSDKASECTMYKVCQGQVIELYKVKMNRNTPAVDRVLELVYFMELTKPTARNYYN